MDEAALVARFPNASKSFIKANATTNLRSPTTKEPRQVDIHPDDTGPVAKLERVVGHGTVVPMEIQKGVGRRFLVRVKSFRKRLLDVDNLAEKYHVDLCRYSGILPSDAPGTTQIEVAQEKVFGKEPERVVIEVFEL